MDISHVILGPVITEKGERLKTQRMYLISVHPDATKVDVKQALKRFYDVQVKGVRVIRIRPKVRATPRGGVREKRHASKRVCITLSKDSNPLDLTSFRAQ